MCAVKPGCIVWGVGTGGAEVRNKVIARVLKEAELIEQWGRGIQKLTRLCLEAGLKKPDIIEAGMFVQVVFYREAEMADEKAGQKSRTEKPDEKTGRKNRTEKPDEYEKTQVAQKKILETVLAQGEITVAIAMELLSLGKSRTAEILGNMVQSGQLVKQGRGRATCYKSRETKSDS